MKVVMPLSLRADPGDVFGAGQSLTLNFGAAGVEVDAADADLGTPAHAVVLASSVGFSDFIKEL